MAKRAKQKFGYRTWTVEKLDCVSDYLASYTQVMKKQNFELLYIDAFAGTGYFEVRDRSSTNPALFSELEESEETSRTLLEGSATRALQIDPSFDKYLFIEQDSKRASDLPALRSKYPHRNIEVIHGEANKELQSLCAQSWTNRRAVLFLDPFGMSVEWKTLEAVRTTEAIDLWYLFPLMGVIRSLNRDGAISRPLHNRLNKLFGCNDWEDQFFRTISEANLFGEATRREKSASSDEIRDFFVSRLKSLHPHVAAAPKRLCTPNGVPLFLPCFAASNPSVRAGEIALRIAKHLFKE